MRRGQARALPRAYGEAVAGSNDATATDHLLSLPAARGAAPRARPEVVSTGIRHLLTTMGLPAFIESRMFDVLAANRLSPSMRPGENRLRSMFLDPAEEVLHPEWARAVSGMVAAFRASIGSDVDDPRIPQLVGELSLASGPFRRLWARHDVKPLAGAPVRMRHPEVGPLELRVEKLGIGGSGGHLLVVYHAEPGSDSAHALALLGTIVATEEAETAGGAARADASRSRPDR